MVESILDREALLAGSFVQSVEIHDELGSTNDRAAELARDPSIALPAIIVARQPNCRAWTCSEFLVVDGRCSDIQPVT